MLYNTISLPQSYDTFITIHNNVIKKKKRRSIFITFDNKITNKKHGFTFSSSNLHHKYSYDILKESDFHCYTVMNVDEFAISHNGFDMVFFFRLFNLLIIYLFYLFVNKTPRLIFRILIKYCVHYISNGFSRIFFFKSFRKRMGVCYNTRFI